MASSTVQTIVSDIVVRRFARGGVIPDENMEAAQRASDILLARGESLEPVVARIGQAALRTEERALLNALLITLHSVELDELARAVGRAVAAKDPARIDGRFTNQTQALADLFR